MLKTSSLALGAALTAVLLAGCSNEPKRAERNMDKKRSAPAPRLRATSLR